MGMRCETILFSCTFKCERDGALSTLANGNSKIEITFLASKTCLGLFYLMMPPVDFLGPPSLYVLMWLLYVNTKHDLLLEGVGCPELQQVLYEKHRFCFIA